MIQGMLKYKIKTYFELLQEKAECTTEFKGYKKVDEVIKDIKMSDKEANYNRLFLWLFPALMYISDYPMYTERKIKFNYGSITDKDEVQGEVICSFLGVLHDLKEKRNNFEGKTVSDIYNLIAIKTRYAAQNNIYKVLGIERQRGYGGKTRCIKMVKPMGKMKDILGNNLEMKIMDKDMEKYLSNKIVEFLKDKSREDIIIFYTSVLKGAGKWGRERFNFTLTEEQLAKLLDVTRRIVSYRKKELRDEFKVYWNRKIEPYI